MFVGTLDVIVGTQFNPVPYGILRFRQLQEVGAFWPGPRKQGYGYLIDMKFGTNNGINNTSKYAKFEIIYFSTFRNMTSQSFLLQKGTSHRDLIFTP